jgi:hypothetical protein
LKLLLHDGGKAGLPGLPDRAETTVGHGGLTSATEERIRSITCSIVLTGIWIRELIF